MKKTIAMLLSLFMILSLMACGNSASRTEQSSAEDNAVENSISNDVSIENDDTLTESNSSDNIGSENLSEAQEDTEPSKEQRNKILVAYFSATNTTEGVAEYIANGLDADIYEIIPEEPYTDADLDYNDNNSRTSIEMNDPNARPAISGSVENMEQYDIVFIGYPIWWGKAPRIVSTFMESYDFSGKTIVPFCTSGSSDIGSSATNLEQLTSGAKWLEGRRLNGNDSQDAVMEWVNSLNLNEE
ncbi:MAG: flavodoxin [Clostridiales bacterium]|nr:flavodoxin [Clostridiales bacterium]